MSQKSLFLPRWLVRFIYNRSCLFDCLSIYPIQKALIFKAHLICPFQNEICQFWKGKFQKNEPLQEIIDGGREQKNVVQSDQEEELSKLPGKMQRQGTKRFFHLISFFPFSSLIYIFIRIIQPPLRMIYYCSQINWTLGSRREEQKKGKPFTFALALPKRLACKLLLLELVCLVVWWFSLGPF